MDIHSLMNNDAGAPAPASARPPQHAPEQQQQQQHPHPQQREQRLSSGNSTSFPPPQRSASGTYGSAHGSVHGSPMSAHHHAPPPPPTYYAQKPQVPPYQHPHPHQQNVSHPSTPMAPLHTPLHTPQQQQYPAGQYPFPHQQSPQQPQPYPSHMTPRQPSHPPYQHSMSPTPPVVHRSPQVYPGHGSQPSTPLGPPMQPYARQPQQPPVAHVQQHQHPHQHQRSVSATSYGLQSAHPSQSPAPSLPPSSAYPPESPEGFHKRRSTGYMSNPDRDRSVSVSPKTKLVLPTRHNSQDAVWTERDRHASYEAPHSAHRSSGDMSNSQAISPLTMTKHPLKASPSSQPRIGSQTPQLRNILNDDPSHNRSPMLLSSPAAAVAPSIPPPPQYAHSHTSVSNGSPVQTFDSRPIVRQEPPSTFTSESLLQQPVAPSATPQSAHFQNMPQPHQPTLKRAAESSPERTDPPKKTKKRYAEPPIWARYAKGNPRYDEKVAQSLGPPPEPAQTKRPSPRPALQVVPPQQHQQPPQPQPPAQTPTQPPATNGHAPSPAANGQAPPPPPIHPLLGPWEMNIANMEPTEPLVHAVGDYLFNEMLNRPDVGVGDARNGALEIEAKLGTLVDRNTDQRLRLPILTPVVLAREYSQNVRFESFMTEAQHKCMNEYLNRRVQESFLPGRVKMEYKHRYEIDSFAPFTPAGLEALPQSAKNYLDDNRRRNLKLRTTINERAPPNTNPVLARIVKIRLADLDIYWPQSEFDCRISINIEVDMNNRPDVDPSLIVDMNDTKSGGERKKDRLSYKHLAYSVDLTQVKTPDGRKIHELEVEVDGVRLREQAERAQAGQGEGYEAMVRGLVSNMFTLMRIQVPPRR